MKDDDGKIVNFETAKNCRDVNPLLRSEIDGEHWFQFCVDYTAEDGRYGFNIFAKNIADAELRLQAIKENAQIVGMLAETIDGGGYDTR